VTVVVSNRGPYRFVENADGSFGVRPAAGGLSSALRPLLTSGAAGEGASWVAAALSDSDRAAIRAGAVVEPGIGLHLLDLDPALQRLHYDIVSNQVLGFLHHGLFDLVRRPRFDHRFREAWRAYDEVNQTFARAVTALADENDAVLVQDYHLALVPGYLSKARPDLRVVHFTHIPFCGPNSIRVLPTAVAEALCASMASVPCGFHAERWAKAYQASAREVLGNDTAAPVFVAPLGPHAEQLEATASSDEAVAAGREIDALVGDRSLIVRSDRIDPAKNIVRGFLAYDLLLAAHADLRERVVFLALLNASRESLPEYQAYHQEVETAAARVNERWRTPAWEPIVVDTRDDFTQTTAALKRYNVLVVNSIKDGLNLVAKEGPLLNERNGVLCLSPDAGAWDELAGAALAIHPFDIEQSAAALYEGLTMPDEERNARAEALRARAAARTPRDWLDNQLSQAS